jgi:hypothetical protein
MANLSTIGGDHRRPTVSEICAQLTLHASLLTSPCRARRYSSAPHRTGVRSGERMLLAVSGIAAGTYNPFIYFRF